MSFVLNNFPHSQTRPTGNSSWENTYSSKYTQSKGGYLLKSERASGIDGQHQLQGTQPPPAFCMPNHDSNRLSPCRGTPGTFFDQGFSLHPSMISCPKKWVCYHSLLDLVLLYKENSLFTRECFGNKWIGNVVMSSENRQYLPRKNGICISLTY